MSDFIVHGTVRQAPTGCSVHAFDRDLRTEEPLGHAQLDPGGRYEIRYNTEQFRRAEKLQADLIVRVLRSDGSVAAESPILFNAGDDEVVDLVVGPDRSAPNEYASLVTEITPLLSGVPIHLLREDREHKDVSFLSGDTGREPDQILALIAAHRLMAETKVDAQGLYGLFRLGLPMELPRLVALGTPAHRSALEAAITRAIISPELRSGADAFLRLLAAQTVEPRVALLDPSTLYAPVSKLDARFADKLNERLRQALVDVVGPMNAVFGRAIRAASLRLDYRELKPDLMLAEVVRSDLLEPLARDRRFAEEAQAVMRRLNAESSATTIEELLGLSLPVQENGLFRDEIRRARAFKYARAAKISENGARALVERSGGLEDAPKEAFDSLVAEGIASVEQAAHLHFMFGLGRLTSDNSSLADAVRSRNVRSLGELAAWRTTDWEKAIADSKAPLPPGETAASYAASLQYSIEQTFPSASLIARSLTSSGALRPHLEALLRDNPGLDLGPVDFFDKRGGGLDWSGVPEVHRGAVRNQLMTYQRVLNVSDEIADAEVLIRSGYDSATAIARVSERHFVATSGLPRDSAKIAYAKAKGQSTEVSLGYLAVMDALKGLFNNLGVGNVYPSMVNDLAEIDGLVDLFGEQDYCDCQHCRSILSPAAYFVDLMHFVEQHISQAAFVATNMAQHPLYLKRRRPDLWKLQLSCENTDTLVPYLTIVNEVLEDHLDTLVSGDIYETLANPSEKHSARLPFTRPFEELQLYLSHFGLALHEIYDLLAQPEEKVWRARLGLSPAEFDVITGPDTAGVAQRFGAPASLAAFPVNDYRERRGFIQYSGITREQLDELLASRFRTDLAHIKNAHVSAPAELQSFRETLEQLTAPRLDFIHRFVRLWRRTGWSIADLDLVLHELHATGLIGGEIDAEAVTVLGKLIDLQTALKLKVEEVCALATRLPVSRDFPGAPAASADVRVYERLFDLNAFFGEADPVTHAINLTAPYHCYSLNSSNPDDHALDPRTPMLLGALSISETDLLLLFDLLGTVMPFDAKGDTTLDRDRISVLYRHARLARALKLGVDDLIQALRLIFDAGNQVVTSLDQISTLVDFRAWLKNSPFNMSEIRFILRGEESAALKYQTTTESAASLVLEARASAEPDKLVALSDGLARSNGISAAQLADVLHWTVIDIADPGIATALAATFTEGVPDEPDALAALVDLTRGVERALCLFKKLKFDADTVHYLTYAAAALGIANPAALTLANLRALRAYRLFSTLGDESEPLVQRLLDAYQTTHAFTSDHRAYLADLWQQERSLIDSLIDSLKLPVVAIDALQRLSDVLSRCVTLGVNGFSLSKLADDSSFAGHSAARDVALGAFSSKYADEAERALKLDPYQDQVNTLRRDALCDYMISRQIDLKFKDLSDIYAYFLLDVEMSGCFRTSRIVCATGSLQLYVQRCLQSLERSDPDLNPNLPDVRVDPTAIRGDEWDWRRNYRVWEANRKVFLYPESYIEPDLRDDKTPIFEELESELLQEKITVTSAEAAYRTYMKAFAELTRLKHAGSYRDSSTKTYYFFARTCHDPPQYYYRTWDAKTWTPWLKIDLGINATYVAAASHLGRLHLFWAEGRTKEINNVIEGSSKFDRYQVNVDLGYSFVDEHGKWAPARKIPWLYPSEAANAIADENRLRGMELSKEYRKVFPRVENGAIVLSYSNSWLSGSNTLPPRELDVFNNKLRGSSALSEISDSRVVAMRAGTNTARLVVMTNDSDETEADFDNHLELDSLAVQQLGGIDITLSFPKKFHDAFDPSREDVMHLVHAGYPSVVFTLRDQQYLIRRVRSEIAGGFYLGPEWQMIRLSTSLANDLGQILFKDGLETFLSLDTQKRSEKSTGITTTAPHTLAPLSASTEHLDFKGAYGTYYRELFFHVPFRIASHLNANSRFEEAQWWYSRIFDPTAREAPDDQKPTDRNWRYIEFRDIKPQTLKDILCDKAAIAVYESNPFNPHAIARLRLSAYQKAIVMKYIDNLLDWGDSLFARDTMESINEATMLYVMAADILGKRPVKLGACASISDSKLTYESLGPAIAKGSEFLIALENWHLGLVTTNSTALEQQKAAKASRSSIQYNQLAEYKTERARQNLEWLREAEKPSKLGRGIGQGVIQQHSTLAFCIPPNNVLLAYWDRVEDRLYKIRNCMNIRGVRRSLALFAPEIDPMALVRAVAAGLSLDEALSAPAAPVPPYRFSFLIEKAKQFVQTVQAFGGALLSALEKKDVEELTVLRSVHERNIQRMTKEIKKRALQDNQLAYQSIVEQQTNVQNRIDHYAALIETGLTSWESAEQIFRHTATGLKLTESLGHQAAAISYLIPQLGSPFAIKYGGKEIGDSISGFANLTGAVATMNVAMAESAALEATFQRREQDWDHQLVLARQEWKQVEQQRLAAEIKIQVAERDLAIHDKSIEQSEELHEFYGTKFTHLGLYEYLATTLNRLYRQAYNVAEGLARMAECSYQFEHDSSESFIAGDNWQFDRTGLLAGERLMLQLNELEKAYLQQNVRDYEVTQLFSLALIDPNALLRLRETGACDFSIPEVLLDMAYPGQYRRLIKSVRLSVPCVAGPYTNIGAKLTLKTSKLRRTPTIAPDALVDIPNQKLTSIATSTAQNDGGTFELSFRDERYLPFEGAGAISTWSLEFPSQTRTFDYDTISDVIVGISYTAKDDSAFRLAVENQVVDALTELASTQGMFRLLSLRFEFPDVLQKLLHTSGAVATAELNLTEHHFPYFLRKKELMISELSVMLKPSGEDPVDTAGMNVAIGGASVQGGWSLMPGTSIRVGKAPVSGVVIRTWPLSVGGTALDDTVLEDVLILVKYTL